tara:strand:- start:177 stop:611 length:435 start_codon:yes stop_codon:yes gene_type:complete
MLSIGKPGSDAVNESYVPEHDILNCVPGAFSGMCQLIQSIDIDASRDKMRIPDDEMLKAVKAMRYLLSNDSQVHVDVVDAYKASGLLDCSWQARTWVLKNLGDMMVRLWFQSAKARINNNRGYYDYYVNAAAEQVARSVREKRV